MSRCCSLSDAAPAPPQTARLSLHDALPISSKSRGDLAWPGAVLGRIAERRGDVKGAEEWYRRSLEGLQTTQSFTEQWNDPGDRKSTRLNSSHLVNSYAAFCLKKKKAV